MDITVRDILLILVGFVLAWVPQWFDRRRRLRANWAAIRAEIALCNERANHLLSDGVMAPVYRLPTMAYEKGFPALLGEGELSEAEALSLGRYFCQVQDLNRGLDNAAAVAHDDERESLEQEHRRNISKAAELLTGSSPTAGHSGEALVVVSSKLQRRIWRL